MKGSQLTTLPLRKANPNNNTANARTSGGLSALADPPTAEETAFASMTLVLRELLRNEPSYADEELMTSSTSAGNVAQWERDDIAAFTLDSRFSPPRRQSGRVSSGSEESAESSSEGSSPDVVGMAEKLDTTTLVSSRKAAFEAHAFVTSIFAAPSSSRCAARMYQIVTSLCVYANHNLHLRGSIGEVPQLYYDLCVKGRDAAAIDPPIIAKNLFGDGSPTKRPPGPSKPNVSFQAEVGDSGSRVRDGTDILSLLATSNVPKGASDAIMESYYLERLLDDGLPPAVCSSRFEGLAALLLERKRRVVGELMASRNTLGAMIKAPNVTGSQMLSLLKMGAHANPKLRVKLYDRFVQEGGIWALLKGSDSKARTILSQEGLHIALDALLLLMDPALDDCDPLLGTGAIPSCDGEPAGSPRGKPSKTPPPPPPSQQQAPSPNPRCTAWTSDTDMLASVLSFIVNSVKRVSSESALRVGPTMLKIPHNPFTLPSGVQALWSKASLLLQYVIAHNATMAAVVVGVMDSVLEQVLCLCVQLFLPPMLTLLKRPEAKDHEESIVEWFSVLAAQVTFVRGDISRGVGFASPLQLTTNRKSLLKIQIPASPISPRPGHKTVPISPSPLLTKAAMEGVVPYLAFARAVAMHTRWRDGVVIFFSRCVNAADAIVLQARRRPNVLFGTACDCLLAVGPLVVGKPPVAPASPSIARPVTVLPPAGRRSGSKRGRSPSGPASPTARPSGATSEGTPDLNSLTLMPPREDFSAEPCSPKHIKGLRAEDSPNSPIMGIALSPPTPGISPLPLTSQVPWRERMSLALFGSSWGEPMPPRSPSTPGQLGGGKRRTASK